MMIPESVLSRLPWRKSARSGSGNATCVEVVAIEFDRE
jgi:hypothetical protein